MSDNALNALQQFMDNHPSWETSRDGSDLWDLISAFRGPDGGQMEGLKRRTTCCLRAAIAPKFFGVDPYEAASLGPPHKPRPDEGYDGFVARVTKTPHADGIELIDDHFIHHYCNACIIYWRLKEV